MKTFNLLVLLIFFCKISNGQCEIETKRITVFKDATVFVEREGSCAVNQNKILLDVPYQDSNPTKPLSYNQRNTYVRNHIILGTLEVQSPGNKVVSTRSIKVENIEDLHSIQQVFDNNKGKKIKVTLKETKEEITGNIYSVEHIGSAPLGSKSNLKSLILKSGEKWSFVNLTDLSDFEFLEKPDLTKNTKRAKLMLNFEKNNPNQNIKISYLQKGITWTPNYFINIKDEKNLELSLKANVANDIAELSNVELNLAVGVPVFKYSPIGDPLFSSQRVIELITKLNKIGENPKSPMTNVITSQVSSGYIEDYGNNVTPKIEGQSKDDIFLYKLDQVSLSRYDRINLDILKMKSEFKNLFVANLTSNEGIVSSSKRNEKFENINVWHALKFDNNTGMPLTTGAVFFKKNKVGESKMMPISQGQLNFTPIGKHCIVKMSVSPNIIVHDSDVEVSREKDTRGYGYLVEVEAEIEVNNFKNEKIEMMITREIRGTEIKESSEDWEIVKSTRSLYDHNQKNLVKWNFEVEANDNKIIRYKYQVFVR